MTGSHAIEHQGPKLPVIGGIAAAAGLLQVNALVSAGATPGPSVPIALTVGGVRSPAGVTIAIK